MGIPSVASIQFLVNYVRLCWHRQRRLSASRLWWLWLLTILIHLLLSVSTVVLSEPVVREEAEVVICLPHSPERPYLVGVVALLLVLRPGESSPFPWLRWRARLVVRRRRLVDMSLDELLALLPPGVRTIAWLVERLTRSQMVKLLAAIPILYPILAELDVEAIIDKHCPTEAEVNIGAVIVILCLNRLTASLLNAVDILEQRSIPRLKVCSTRETLLDFARSRKHLDHCRYFTTEVRQEQSTLLRFAL